MLLTVDYAGVAVSWRADLDGGGRAFGQDYVPIVGQLFGRVGRLLEFCAGPGFIGFSLLARGLCDSLALVDINPEAVEVARETVRRNGLEDRVSVYESNVLDGVPAGERFDLVVANPPHFLESPVGQPSRITDDPGWHIHRRFYRDVGHFLAPGGSVLLQENSEGSRPEDFYPMLTEGGLIHRDTFWYVGAQGGPSFYYVWAAPRIPGLSSHREPVALPVRLAGPAGPLVDVVGPGPFVLRPRNETDHPVRVQLVGADGRDQLWLPLPDIAVGGALDLPPLSLRPGIHRLVDRETGEPYATLRVSAAGDQ
jgi:SAM-dependent methyltransferase